MPKTTTTSGNMTITVDTTGLDRWLDQLGTRREDYLDAFAAKVEARAKTVAPVDTGNLKNSIHFWKPQEGVRRIGDGVEYGIYQELGTSRMGRGLGLCLHLKPRWPRLPRGSRCYSNERILHGFL